MGNIRLDVAITIAVSLELFVYGIYATIFASTCSVIITRQSLRRTHSTAWIYRVAALATFILATLHISLELFRFLRAFITPQEPRGGVLYMYDFTMWTTVFSTSVFVVIIWIGNALLVTRCFYVWNKNIWIVITPFILQLALMGSSIYLLFWLNNVDNPKYHLSPSTGKAIYRTVYMVALIQNTTTTGLIILKMYIQHATFGASGPKRRTLSSRVDGLIRVMVESAMIYWILTVLVTSLYLSGNNARHIFQYIAVPTTGIIFLIMAIRVQTAKSSGPPKRSGLRNLPGWLGDTEDGDGDAIEFSRNKASSSQPGVLAIRVSVENFDLRDDFSDPSGSSSFPHKRNKIHSCDSPL